MSDAEWELLALVPASVRQDVCPRKYEKREIFRIAMIKLMLGRLTGKTPALHRAKAF